MKKENEYFEAAGFSADMDNAQQLKEAATSSQLNQQISDVKVTSVVQLRNRELKSRLRIL